MYTLFHDDNNMFATFINFMLLLIEYNYPNKHIGLQRRYSNKLKMLLFVDQYTTQTTLLMLTY